MPVISRRSFVERLGLGAGAVLLGSIASTLEREARGQVMTRKRVMFVLQSNGFPHWTLAPAEFRDKLDVAVPGTTTYSWPMCVAPLAAYRSRMLLIDGLANRGSGQHSSGYGALSAFEVAEGSGEGDGPPGNITIDQFIANQICKDVPLKSILWGVSSSGQALETKVFAADRRRPVPHYLSQKLLFNRVFGNIGPNAAAGSGRRRLVLDALRNDIKRLQGGLAPSERRKFEHYQAALEEYDSRQKITPKGTCTVPSPADDFPVGTPIDDKLIAMNDLATLAITCGISNVVGVSAGCGFGHNSPTFSKIQAPPQFLGANHSLDFHGHDPLQPQAMEYVYSFMSGMILRSVQAWEKIKEGDRTIFDNTAIVMMSDNAEAHHASHVRYPLVVIGNAGGALKADGRFIRFPLRTRALGDFYSTLATAVGAPTNSFGKGGREKTMGGIPELA